MAGKFRRGSTILLGPTDGGTWDCLDQKAIRKFVGRTLVPLKSRNYGDAEAKDAQGNQEAVYRDRLGQGQVPQPVSRPLAKPQACQAKTPESRRHGLDQRRRQDGL